MNHYKIQELNDVYELYKFNPSTGEETLLSTEEEYTTAINELLALKAWLYLSYNTSEDTVPYIASYCKRYSSYPYYNPGIRASFDNLPSISSGGTSYLDHIEVLFGNKQTGEINKPSLILKYEHASRLHPYRIILGENQVSGGEYPLEDIPVKNIIDGETDQEITYPFNMGGSSFEGMILELYSGGDGINVSNSLSESPFTNLRVVVPLQVSIRVSYNGNYPRTIISGIINSDLFDGPQKIEAVINSYIISSASDLKFTISPLIPSSTETV